MTNQTKNTPAAREDAEEEQRTPQAGDVLTEQQALLTDKMQQACQMLVQTIIKERAESKRKDEIIKLKDEVISRKDKEIALKDEELAWMRAESERKDAAHAKELDRVRANEIAFRKAAVTFLRETPVESRKNAQTFPVALETLNTLKARSLIEKLINSGLLDEHWQLFCDRSLVRERPESKTDKYRQDRYHDPGHDFKDNLMKFFQNACDHFRFCPCSGKPYQYRKDQRAHNTHDLWDLKPEHQLRQLFQTVCFRHDRQVRNQSVSCAHRQKRCKYG